MCFVTGDFKGQKGKSLISKKTKYKIYFWTLINVPNWALVEQYTVSCLNWHDLTFDIKKNGLAIQIRGQKGFQDLF